MSQHNVRSSSLSPASLAVAKTLRAQVGSPSFSLEGFLDLWEYIHARSGISFAENKLPMLKDRTARRMLDLNFRSYADYLGYLRSDSSDSEFRKLMDIVTINETSFFRCPGQFDCFREFVLPDLERVNRPARSMRIWSAACSTGEEPYTIAIVLLDALPDPDSWAIHIRATDISIHALEAARRGVYAPVVVQDIPRVCRDKYFKACDGQHCLDDRVKRLAHFEYENLVDVSSTPDSCMDAVFCRNTMIYFSQKAQSDVAASLYRVLRPGGFLMIGHNESLHGVSKQFELLYHKNVMVYRKPAA
jgi:chemotaxis protein methyltransferase CheR